MTAQQEILEGIRPDLSLLPASSEQQTPEAPAQNAGSFSIDRPDGKSGSESYGRYIHLPKGLLAPADGRKLLAIYRELSQHTSNATYLNVAGWAIAEAALITCTKSPAERHNMLERAEECWSQTQDRLLATCESKPGRRDAALRVALSLSSLPQLHDVVDGQFSKTSAKSAVEQQFAIAKRNKLLLEEAVDDSVAGVHGGFGYELLGIILPNAIFDHGQFMMAASARADSGYDHKAQTHDIVFVNAWQGRIRAAVPSEVKRVVREEDKVRYRALLIAGEADLNFEGKSQSETIELIEEAYYDPPSLDAYRLLKDKRAQLMEKIRVYTQGARIRRDKSWQGRTRFYESTSKAS